jgi:hypothetical protein
MSEHIGTLRRRADEAAAKAKKHRAAGKSGDAEFYSGVQVGLVAAIRVLQQESQESHLEPYQKRHNEIVQAFNDGWISEEEMFQRLKDECGISAELVDPRPPTAAEDAETDALLSPDGSATRAFHAGRAVGLRANICICSDLGATGDRQRHTLCRAHDEEGPEPDGYRYLGGGRYGSTSR